MIPLIGGAGHGMRHPATTKRVQVPVYDERGRCVDYYGLVIRGSRWYFRFVYRRRGWASPRADFLT